MRQIGGIHDPAARQHGVVTRTQLLEAGWSPSRVDRAHRAHRLLRLHNGVYAVGHRAITDRGRWMAAVLACGPDAVLSYRSAAALDGLLARDTGLSHITAPALARHPRVIAHRATLAAADHTVWRGIP